MHELIKALINRKDENEAILNIVKDNKKSFQIFRCNKCFDILFISHNKNGASFLCNNQSHSITNSKLMKAYYCFDTI